MADAVAEKVEPGVARVLAELEAFGLDVGVDLLAPDRVERAEELERAIVDDDLRGGFGQGEVAAATEQVEEDGLDAVVGVVAEDELAAAVLATESLEKQVAGVAGGGLEREFFGSC